MARWAVVGLTATVLAGCGGDGKTLRDTVFDPPATVAPSTVPAPTMSTEATAATAPIDDPADGGSALDEATERVVVIDRLDSPANATAEIAGRGAVPGDSITVDGQAADVLSFTTDERDGFVARVWIEDEGAHTVCVAATCGRVYTRAPDAETADEIVAKIEAALPLAAEYVDVDAEFPGWSISIGGALSGTGGSTDVETKTVTIYRNRGRSIDDYVRTVLHELGHVADFERLTDQERDEYRMIRGIDIGRAWSDAASHRIEDWAQQPNEDFAEVMVAIWTDGRWQPRTLAPTPPPTADQRSAVAGLVDPG